VNGATSIEQLLTEFSHILVPFGEELGGPAASATVAGMVAAIKPFIALFCLNLIMLSMRHYIIKMGLSFIQLTFGLAFYWLLFGGILRRRSSEKVLRARLREHNTRAKKKKPVEEEPSYKSWDQFCHGTVFWSFGGDLSDDVKNALSVLGIHAFSTQCDVRKAYLDLMKKYHPDRFAQRPEELEQAQHTTVKVREAYDRISKQFCQAQ
jgi:hypothetical protein